VGLGVATGPLDSAVNIAFPAITQAFDISLPTIQWVIICYVLTYASLLLSCGRLGDVIGHRRVFLRVPLAVLSAVLMLLLLRHPAVVKPSQQFDVPGAISLALALAGLLFAFNRAQHVGWLSLPALGLFAGACVCLAFFVWHEVRCPEPIITLSLFRQPAFTIANLTHILAQVAGFTILLLVPYYLLNYYHVTATLVGLLLAMAPLGTVLASPVSGALLSRFAAHRLSLYGLLLIAGGLGGSVCGRRIPPCC
jgi:MFS family permease